MRLKMMYRSWSCSVDSATWKKTPWRFHPCGWRGERRFQAAESSRFFRSFSRGQKTLTFVRFWRPENEVRCVWEGKEKKKDLTRNRSNTSGRPEDDEGSRKPRRSVAAGDGVDEELDDSLIDSLRACVEVDQDCTTEQ